MKKLSIVILFFTFSTLAWAGSSEVKSLRGDTALDAPSVNTAVKEWHGFGEGTMNRNYNQQPPLISHDIENFAITRQDNSCLACHNMNSEIPGATKVAVSHFLNRDNEALVKISPRRYFCTQCHVPQVGAKPLVPNTFKSLVE